jgi:hypothetical protein
MERAKPRIFLISFVGCLFASSRSVLFKPRSSRPAAAGEEQVAISVEELDGGAIGEAVGAGEMDVGGDYPRPSKGTVFVIGVRYIVEGVILPTWLALPETSLGGVERAGTGRVSVGGQIAVAVKGHYGWERRSRLVGIITVDSHSGYLPHALDCRSYFSWRSVRAPQQ